MYTVHQNNQAWEVRKGNEVVETFTFSANAYAKATYLNRVAATFGDAQEQEIKPVVKGKTTKGKTKRFANKCPASGYRLVGRDFYQVLEDGTCGCCGKHVKIVIRNGMEFIPTHNAPKE